MKWLCLGTLHPHHPIQDLSINSKMESNYRIGLEFNGLGAHSYALSKIGEDVTEIRLAPHGSKFWRKFIWRWLLNAEAVNPELKSRRLNLALDKLLSRLKKEHFDCFFSREVWDYPMSFLKELEDLIPVRILWLSTSPGRAPYPEIWEELKCFTHIFLIDREGVNLLREKGYNAFYMPFALADFEEISFRSPKDLRLGFLGSVYPDRMMLLQEMRDHGLEFWAPNFSGGTELMYPDLVTRYRGEVWGLDLLKEMSRYEIIINPIHRSYMRGMTDDVTNFRLFEAIGVRTFQIAEHKSAIREIFTEDEIATYASLEELKDKIIFYGKHSQVREKMVTKAHARVQKEHLYSHRMQDICKEVS